MPINQEAAIEHLCQVLRCKTLSESEDEASHVLAFEQLHTALATNYPEIFKALKVRKFGKFALLLEWEGRDKSLLPMLYIAHQDVVPVPTEEEKNWQYPPFSGTKADGYICGRGALDMKSTLVAILEAVEQLLLSAFQPQRTLYIYLGDDEEIGGATAKTVAEWMQSENIQLEYILDEGGLILERMMPELNVPIAFIGIGQKGMLNLELTVHGESGHSSKPLPRTPIDILSEALVKLKKNEPPVHYDSLVFPLLQQLAPHMPWGKRFVLSLLRPFKALLSRKLVKNPLMNAWLRTTTAPTIFQSGFKTNVLPEVATAVVNFRLYPNDTPDQIIDHVKKVIKNPEVSLRVLDAFAAPKLSSTESDHFKTLEKTIRNTNDEAILVAPALIIGGTDGRHFRGLTRNIYHFQYMQGTMDDFKGYHGINERISIQNFLKSIHFYHEMIINTQDDHG
jgi:carboxypeptidase PM20D1